MIKCYSCGKDATNTKHNIGICLFSGIDIVAHSIPIIFHYECFKDIAGTLYAEHFDKEIEEFKNDNWSYGKTELPEYSGLQHKYQYQTFVSSSTGVEIDIDKLNWYNDDPVDVDEK